MHIGQYAFRGAKFTSITIPDSVVTIEYSAFESSALQNVIISESSKLESIGSNVFNTRNLMTTDFVIPAGVKRLPSSSIFGYNKQHIINNLVIVDNQEPLEIEGDNYGDTTFEDVKITNIYIGRDFEDYLPSSNSRIDYPLFNDTLESATLGTFVTKLKSKFFDYAKNLKNITSLSTVAPSRVGSSYPIFGSSSSSYTGRNTYNTGENILYVPQGATGYDAGDWLDPLQNASKCGFTISYLL